MGARPPFVVPVLCAWALLGSTPAAAEDPEVAALRRQVNALEQQVRALNARMDQLEGRAPAAVPQATPPAAAPAAAAQSPHAAPPPPPAASAAGPGYVSPEAVLKQRWSSIKPAITNARVTELLGEPTTRFKLDGRDVWYYYYPGQGGGSVFFTDEGKVSSSQSPFGWGW
jgi:outer membrane murein-binding lipoprotein Lpp